MLFCWKAKVYQPTSFPAAYFPTGNLDGRPEMLAGEIPPEKHQCRQFAGSHIRVAFPTSFSGALQQTHFEPAVWVCLEFENWTKILTQVGLMSCFQKLAGMMLPGAFSIHWQYQPMEREYYQF